MTRWLRGARTLLRRNGPREAFAREQEALREAAAMPLVQPAFAEDMARLGTSGEPSVVVGASALDPSVVVRVPLSEYAGLSHSITLGSPGAGKTFGTLAAIAQLLYRFAAGGWAASPASPCVAIADYKSELRELAAALVDDIARGLGHAEARALRDALVVFDPFSTSGVLPMNLVWPDPQVSPETQAYDVASLIDLAAGPQLGVNQDAFTYHLLLLGIHKGDSSLAELNALTHDLPALVSLAAQCPSEEVRLYFSSMRRGGPTSLPGVQSRLSRLLRVPSLRAMLTARGSTSFAQLFASKFLVADVGSPPLGMESLARFAGGLLTMKITRAVFERRNNGPERRLALFVDEFQEGLAGTDADVADAYGRLLTQARSRGISMHLVTQSFDRVARAAPSLPGVIAAATGLAFVYRSSLRDAREMEHILPATGRRPRDPGAPWEARGGAPFLSRAEELRQLVEEVTRLPDRHFYFWNRRRTYRAELVRSPLIRIASAEARGSRSAVPAAAPRPVLRPRGATGANAAPPAAEPSPAGEAERNQNASGQRREPILAPSTQHPPQAGTEPPWPGPHAPEEEPAAGTAQGPSRRPRRPRRPA